MKSSEKYSVALEMYRTTDLTLSEISRRCGVSRTALASYIQRNHRDLMFQRHGMAADRPISEKLRFSKGQSAATEEKYKEAVLACGSSDFIGLNISQIARKFGLSPSGLANQLHTHFPEILKKRDEMRVRLGLEVSPAHGVRKMSQFIYAEAVGLLESDDIPVREVAERCGVSYAGLRQHIYSYHKDVVDDREGRRNRGKLTPKIGRVSGNGSLRLPDEVRNNLYAKAVAMYRDTSLSCKEIAEITGIDAEKFCHYLRMWHRRLMFSRYGIDTRSLTGDRDTLSVHRLSRKSAREKYAEAIECLRSSGMSTEAVAQKFGHNPDVFRHYLKVHHPDLFRENGMTRIAGDRKVLGRSFRRYKEAVRMLADSNGSLREIAVKIGIPYSSFYSFVRRNYPELISERVQRKTAN